MDYITTAIGILVSMGLFWWLLGLMVLILVTKVLDGLLTTPPQPRETHWADPTLSATERWATLAALSPNYTPQLLYHLGYGADLEQNRLDAEWEALRAEPVVPAEPATLPPHFEPVPIAFKEGEPQTFEEYDGQKHFLHFLTKAVRGMRETCLRLERPELFIGPPGMGKTLMAKVIANEIRKVVEGFGYPTPELILAMGSDIDSLATLDSLIRRASAREGNVLFMDEFHTVGSSKYIDKLLLLFDEHRWQFEGDANPTDLPDFTILAGTTDYGALSGALRRRFNERQMRPATWEQLVKIVRSRPFAIEVKAAERIVERTHWGGAPWEALAVRKQAEVVARYAGREVVTVDDVEEVFEVEELDRLGLRPLDRSVLHALLKCERTIKARRKGEPDEHVYVAAEQKVVAMARVDSTAYKVDIAPRLMARGLLMPTSRGQQLTDAGVEHAKAHAA